MSRNHDTHAGDTTGHDAHGPAVEADSSPVDVNRPTPLSAFVWPGLIALLVLILVWDPVTSAFTPNRGGYNANGQPTPTLAVPAGEATAAPIEATLAASTPVTGNAQTVIPQPTDALTAVPTNVQAGGLLTLTPAAPEPAVAPRATAAPATAGEMPTATVAPAATGTAPANTPAPAAPAATAPANTPAPAAPPANTPAPGAAPANTPSPAATPATPAAALPPGSTALLVAALKAVTLAGKTFPVIASTTVVPDWVFSKDPNVANWISGPGVVNYIFGIAYSPANAALFAHVHAADTIRLTETDGRVLPFAVDQVRRIAPTDTRPLAQDHAAITLLLLADPAPDRALIQGRFVEAATP